MKTVAVLLTCHNRKEKTIACLITLFDCPLLENYLMDVFLVDDGSSDGTSDAIREKFPQVNIIQGNGNLFWNRGMHLAWKTAASQYDCDYYLWLNDDTILYLNAIQELLVCSEGESNQKIICGSTSSTNNKNKITYGGRARNGDLIKPNGAMQYCNHFNGNIVLIPRYVYKIVGTNDPIFHHGLGDYDYGLRAKKKYVYSVITPFVLGECDRHLPMWCNPKISIIRRLKLLYTPLGNHPIESFIYEKRHQGLFKAYFHFFTNHLRAIMPVLWKNRSI
jgi:GT2 family glycosyltransferase